MELQIVATTVHIEYLIFFFGQAKLNLSNQACHIRSQLLHSYNEFAFCPICCLNRAGRCGVLLNPGSANVNMAISKFRMLCYRFKLILLLYSLEVVLSGLVEVKIIDVSDQVSISTLKTASSFTPL